MYLKEKLNQNRRDFTAIYACQDCGYEKTDRGYDDEYFHTTVIPKMVCDKCGTAGTPDLRRTGASIPAHVVI